MINPKIPSLEEIIRVANLLDELGESKDAEILDEYIGKFANSTSDIIKYAGFWGNVWGRISGRVKRMFISEWKDLYSVVKESQESLDKMMEVTKQEYDKARSLFKNYKFKEWREEVSNMTYLKKEGLVEKTNQAFANFVKSSLNDYMGGDEIEESQKSEKELNKGEQTILQRTKQILDKDTVAKMSLPEWVGKGYVKVNTKNNNVAVLADKFDALVPSVIAKDDKGEFFAAKKSPKGKGSGSLHVSVQNAFGKYKWKFSDKKDFNDEQYYVFEKSSPVKKQEISPEDVLGPDTVETAESLPVSAPEKPAISTPSKSEPVSTTVAPEVKMPVAPVVAPASPAVVAPVATPVAAKPVAAPEITPVAAPAVSRRDPVVPIGTPSGGLSSVIEKSAPKEEKRMRHVNTNPPDVAYGPGEVVSPRQIPLMTPQEQIKDLGAESDRDIWEQALPPGAEEEYDPSDPLTYAEPPEEEEEVNRLRDEEFQRKLFEGEDDEEDEELTDEDIGTQEPVVEEPVVAEPKVEEKTPEVPKRSREQIEKEISDALSKGVWVKYNENAKEGYKGKLGLVAPSTAKGGKAHFDPVVDPSVISAASARYTKMQLEIAKKMGDIKKPLLVDLGAETKTASRVDKIIRLSKLNSFEETTHNFVLKMKS